MAPPARATQTMQGSIDTIRGGYCCLPPLHNLSSGEESSASDTTPPTTANSAWQSGSGTNLDDTLWSRQPTQTSGQNPAHLGWNITD